ncbi:MAG: flavin reductase family protein [Alphaproteobacteria bacterium]|nr:flavin reductase family protein [Alphaproteobacteria bacterium]
MAKLHWKPGTLLSPVPPALVSSGTMDKPNVMTAAWTGIIASEPAMTYVSIRPSRYSHQIISKTKEFVINLPTLDLADVTDWCGVKTGAKVDKFKETGLIAEKCQFVKAPAIAQSPVSIECKVVDIQHYGTHDMFVAEILGVNVDEKFVSDDGKVHFEKMGILGYMHGFYYTMGRQLGKYGYSVEKGRKTPKIKETAEKTVKKAKK